MANSVLTKLGLININEILSYLKHRLEEQIEAAPILVNSLTFYPQISGEQQVQLFKYLESKGFLSIEIQQSFTVDGVCLYENNYWLEGLEIFTKGIHEPFNKERDIELMKNSHDFRVNLAEDFDIRYQEFIGLAKKDENPIVYQLKIGKKKNKFVLYVKTANMGNRKIRWLTENKVPIKLLGRLLKPENNNKPVDASDLLEATEQTAIQLLNSVLDSTLRSVFFPHTRGTSVFARPVITLEMIYTEKIDRKSIDEKLKNLPRI